MPFYFNTFLSAPVDSKSMCVCGISAQWRLPHGEYNGSVFITTACSAMSVAACIMLSVPYSLTKRLLFVLLHATYTQCHMRVAFKIMHEIYILGV